MADLALVQLVPGPMTVNLERSLAESGSHPWALDKFFSQMVGIRPGVYFVFLRVTLPGGGSVGKAGPIPLDALAHRVVVGRVVSPIGETSNPFFDGYPHEFRFDVVADDPITPAVPLARAAERLNERIEGLSITGEHLRQLLSNARSAKVGMYVDGEPRLAPYFRQWQKSQPGAPLPPPSAVAAPVEVVSTSARPFAMAAAHFARAVADAGLIFDGANDDLPRAFFAALAAKRFAILTGMSGSGKTQLARAFGQWLGTTAVGRNRYVVVPVRADWTSPEPLLGYEDALLPVASDGRRAWSVPSALELVLAAIAEPDRPWLVVLDEMNLAHVERYFADVLSGIESGEAVVPNLGLDVDGLWRRSTIGPALLPLPANLVIIGTVNVDETTYQFSPKVLDRAFSFEFRVGTDELRVGLRSLGAVRLAAADDTGAFLEMLLDLDWHVAHPHPAETELVEGFLAVHAELTKASLEFGHRTFRESLRLAALLHEVGIADEDDAWDWAVMTKFLPRVHGSRRQLEPFLLSLVEYAQGGDVEKPVRPLTARKVGRMLEAVRTNQFVSFSE